MSRMSGSKRSPNKDLVKEKFVEKELRICYNEIDKSFKKFPIPNSENNHSTLDLDDSITTETYVDNEELTVHLQFLLLLLTEDDYCNKYIHRVFNKQHKFIVGISRYGCKNYECISNIYDSLSTVSIKIIFEEKKPVYVDVPLTSYEMKEIIQNQLLQINPMTDRIRDIILKIPLSKPTNVSIPSSNSPTSQSQKPTGYIPKGRDLRTLIPLPKKIPLTDQSTSPRGGKAIKTQKTKTLKLDTKLIFGKERCIYKKLGDQKQYVKYKGNLVTVKEYKYIIKHK